MVRGDSLTYNQRAIRIGSAVMIGGIIANHNSCIYLLGIWINSAYSGYYKNLDSMRRYIWHFLGDSANYLF